MRATHLLWLVCVLSFLCTGCRAYQTRAPVKPPQGLLVTTYEAPITTRFGGTPTGQKVGRASTYYFHDFLITGLDFAWGKAGVKQAAARGGITRINYADYKKLQILGIFGQYTTEVHGK